MSNRVFIYFFAPPLCCLSYSPFDNSSIGGKSQVYCALCRSFTFSTEAYEARPLLSKWNDKVHFF